MVAQTLIHPKAISGICSMCQPQTLSHSLLSVKDWIFPHHQQEIHARHLLLKAGATLLLTMQPLFQVMLREPARTWQQRLLNSTVHLNQTNVATFHCAHPPIAWQFARVTCTSSESLSLTFNYKPSTKISTYALKPSSLPVTDRLFLIWFLTYMRLLVMRILLYARATFAYSVFILFTFSR